MNNNTIIDANNLILGRMASTVAKRLLLGEKITIINAEKAVISGKFHQIINSYKDRMNIRTFTNPLKGPFHARKPDRIVRRTIRGMLPWKKPRGKKAYHKLKVYIGCPDELNIDSNEIETIEEASLSRLKEKFIHISDLVAHIGEMKY
ncbi:MAG: 50S ribosomal protein L13 [Candidatus Lokiarchaeota archaeon]|nr:50S ribosomal protein L13 [Candidatus Lokiarchaeota archaeon]